MITPGEIVRCNLTFKNAKKETIVCNDVVFGRPYEGEFQTKYLIDASSDSWILKRYKITEDVELIKVDVIKSLGFKVSEQSFSSVKRSERSGRQKSGDYI